MHNFNVWTELLQYLWHSPGECVIEEYCHAARRYRRESSNLSASTTASFSTSYHHATRSMDSPLLTICAKTSVGTPVFSSIGFPKPRVGSNMTRVSGPSGR